MKTLLKSRWSWAAVCLVGVVMLAGFKPWGGHGHHGDPAKIAKFITFKVDDALDDLNATDAQRQQIHAIKDRLLKQGEALHADKRAHRKEALAEWDKPNPDATKAHAMVDTKIEEFRRMAHSVVDAVVEVHRILTPEPRAQVSQRVREHLDERQ